MSITTKEINNIRNIGISAHIDSGKTTLTERILFYTNKIHKIEEVRGGGDGATMDFMELEKEKGITITSAATTVFWDDKKINIIDTPGHVDFTVEVERSLRVLDGAILVLCAVAGVQSQSITVDRQMKRYRVPRLAFINKMDRMGSNPKKVLQDLRDKLKLNAVFMQVNMGTEENFIGVIDLVQMKALVNEGEKGETISVREIPAEYVDEANEARAEMLDALSMVDDVIMEDLLEENEISMEKINTAIKKGVQSLNLVPVYMGSAFKNKAVQPLLNSVIQYLPSPIDAEPAVATDVKLNEKVKVFPEPEKKLTGMAFKITDEQFGQLTYFRVYQGTLKKSDSIVNTRTGKKIRVGRIVRMHANSRENIDFLGPGDIAALVGIDCATGDTFCHEGLETSMEGIFVAEPVISLAVKCTDNTAADRMSKALSKFIKEDPTFHVHTDQESNETIISGMGELHLEIYVERMLREFKVPVEVGAPQVNYREAITKPAEFDYTHKKQTGGAGQYACVIGNIEPVDMEEEGANNFEFENLVKGGNIPSEYIGACQKGFEDLMDKGPLAAFQMVGIKVKLLDGKYHDVDSSDMAFRLCSRAAMKQAVSKANPALLEPLMKVEVETPSEYQGFVIGDLSSRRGIIAGSDARDNMTVINALVPLSEMFGYATELRSGTAGKASYTMEFEKYTICPKNIQEKIIAERAVKLKELEEE